MGAAFEVNRQMYDIEKGLSEAGYFRKICEGQIEARKKLIDMEKKKMTKAEAFEYLNNKKVYVNGKSAQIQGVLFDAGFSWADGKDFKWLDKPFLFISADRISFSNNMVDFKHMRSYEEISADDILSIEIVEGTPEFSYDKVVELAKPLMHYLSETGHTEVISVCKEGISAIPMGTFLYKG